jgi:hypothetical protein
MVAVAPQCPGIQVCVNATNITFSNGTVIPAHCICSPYGNSLLVGLFTAGFCFIGGGILFGCILYSQWTYVMLREFRSKGKRIGGIIKDKTRKLQDSDERGRIRFDSDRTRLEEYDYFLVVEYIGEAHGVRKSFLVTPQQFQDQAVHEPVEVVSLEHITGDARSTRLAITVDEKWELATSVPKIFGIFFAACFFAIAAGMMLYATGFTFSGFIETSLVGLLVPGMSCFFICR